MIKLKILSVILVIVTLCGLCLVFAGCPEKEQERYDILIKVACQEVVNDRVTGPILDEWIFTLGTDEINTEREYDGKQYTYFVRQVAYPNHPTFQSWYDVSSGVTSISWSFGKKMMAGEPQPKYVCEKGEYGFIVHTFGKSDKFKDRSVLLRITVK